MPSSLCECPACVNSDLLARGMSIVDCNGVLRGAVSSKISLDRLAQAQSESEELEAEVGGL